MLVVGSRRFWPEHDLTSIDSLGNQAVGPGGLPGMQYGAGDGGRSMRVFRPCDSGSCDWDEVGQYVIHPK